MSDDLAQERHFVAGPRPQWNWQGRCIWRVDSQTYAHHSQWPTLSTGAFPLSLGKLQHLIESGEWLEVIVDPHLVLDEGL